ncbi:MAG: YlmC/YmxH family sporulation protein [Clostridia bacterium]|nr:YlmC/YmxH family sporulation protein [Clostridia bacterium]MBQ7788204.1 YlmC/YmxH family sporulation protein [Clostridia bacterium]
MNESLTDITEKQVVNLCDGKILGYVIDFKIDICTGRLTAIIIPGEGGIFGFKKCTDIIIPWEKICKIGTDTIIVDIGVIDKDECCDNEKRKKKKGFFS